MLRSELLPFRQPDESPLLSSIPTLERWADYTSYAGATPEKVSQVLRSTHREHLERFVDMCDYMLETDAHIAALYGTRIAAVEQAPWEIEPAHSDDPGEQELARKAAEFIKAVLSNVNDFQQSVSSMLSAIGLGHSVHEVIYRREKNFWVIDRFEFAHLRRFTFDADWNLALYDKGAYGFEGKALSVGQVDRQFMTSVLVHKNAARTGYPDRMALFRVNLWNWVMKIWLVKFWMSAAERFGNPLTIATVPPNAPPTVRSKARLALERLSHDHAAVIEDPVSIEMLKGMMEGGATFKELMLFLDSRDSKALVGSTLNAELQSVGSYAAAESQAERTIEPRAVADAQKLSADLREQVFGPLLKLNSHLFGGMLVPTPHIRFQVVQEPKTNIEPWMIQVPGTIRRNEVRKQAGLSQLSDPEGGEQFVTQTPAPGSMGGLPTQDPFPSTHSPSSPSLSQAPMIQQTSETWRQPISSPSMNPLEHALKRA